MGRDFGLHVGRASVIGDELFGVESFGPADGPGKGANLGFMLPVASPAEVRDFEGDVRSSPEQIFEAGDHFALAKYFVRTNGIFEVSVTFAGEIANEFRRGDLSFG